MRRTVRRRGLDAHYAVHVRSRRGTADAIFLRTCLQVAKASRLVTATASYLQKEKWTTYSNCLPIGNNFGRPRKRWGCDILCPQLNVHADCTHGHVCKGMRRTIGYCGGQRRGVCYTTCRTLIGSGASTRKLSTTRPQDACSGRAFFPGGDGMLQPKRSFTNTGDEAPHVFQ